MPASLKRIRESGALVLEKKCEVCGEDNASFGIGVSMRNVFKFLDAGDKVRAKHHLGKWYCGKHVPAKAASGQAD